MFTKLCQLAFGATIRIHEIFGNNLKPIELGRMLEDMRVMLRAQAKAKA